MKRSLLLLLFLSIGFALQAQPVIVIDGHRPFCDEQTQQLLFVTTAESLSKLTAEVAFDPRWKNVQIEGKTVGTRFRFGNATRNRSYRLTAQVDGRAIAYDLHFTALPVLQLLKGSAFQNDYQEARMVVDTPDRTFCGDTLCIKVKHRGGSTNQPHRHKRNYHFKITDEGGKNKECSFLGMRKDKGWLLDAGQIDLFRLRNAVCHRLWIDSSVRPRAFKAGSQAINGCRNQPAEVFVNNEYRGIYSVMEPVDRKQLQLEKYDKKKTGVNGCLWKSKNWNGTRFFNAPETIDNAQPMWMGFEAKYPKPGDDADTTSYQPLAQLMACVAQHSDMGFKSSINQLLDVPVYNDYVLFTQLINGLDNCGKNLYWSVCNRNGSENERLLFPTPWDMDCTLGQWYDNDVSQHDSTQIKPTANLPVVTRIDQRMGEIFGAVYTQQLAQRYAQLRQSVWSRESLQQRFAEAAEMMEQSGAADREEKKWSGDSDLAGLTLNFKRQRHYILAWIKGRLDFLDAYYHYVPTSIAIPKRREKGAETGPIYNLLGQRIHHLHRGQLYICNGKKHIAE